MTHRKYDLVQETSTSTGTGALTLAGAVTRRKAFSAVLSNADTCYVLIESASAAEWEICLATYNSGGNTLSRGAVLASSTGSAVSFSAGTKTISLIAPAAKSIVEDNNGDVSVTRDAAIGRNATVAGTLGVTGTATMSGALNVVGAITKTNSVEAAGTAGSLRIFDNGSGSINGFGTSTGRFDIRSVSDWAFYSGSGATLAALLTPTAFTLASNLLVQFSTPDAIVRNGAAGALYFGVSGLNIWQVAASGGHFLPVTDNITNIGSASFRAGVIYAGTGTINTSGRDAKQFIGEAIAAEKRAAATIKAKPRRYKLADAVEKKGEDGARWHFGYIAEDVRDALAAEGLDPWAYGFLCSDPIVKRETYFETAMRPKMRKVPAVENVIELRDGRPVMVHKAVERDEPVGELMAVFDEEGRPVTHQIGEDEKGEPIVESLTHFVPEMEAYEEERTREIDTGEARLGLRYSELEAFLRCAD